MRMEKGKKGEDLGVDEEKWVYDSSVDHRGRIPPRATTGVWKASLFVIAIEFSERLSYFGIATSLIIYLTKVIHQDLKVAAKSCNYWSGVTTMMPLVGGFLADAYLGRFTTVLASSSVYLLGLILLIMSRLIPSLKPCDAESCHEPRKIHEVVFFIAIYLISVGTGGHKPALESFGADQFDEDHPEERRKKMSFFNWWNFGLCSGLLFGVTVIVYVQDHVSWAVADIILTAVMAASIVIFCAGRPVYRYRKPTGSPLTPMLQVLVAAINKRNLPYPSNPDELYEVPKSQKTQGRLLCHTDKLKFLDKAGLHFDSSRYYTTFQSRASVVEEIKNALKDTGVDMIGVHGPGGAGKTTMVTEVAKEVTKLGIFDKFVIAVVSKDPNTSKLQEELASQLDFNYKQRSEIGRADELRKALLNSKRKKLVILDDLWQVLDLNSIGIPISGLGDRGFKILLTSCNEEVFRKMKVRSCFRIGYLEEQETWELFKKVIDGDFGVDESIARKVSKRCGDLPIAIVAVGAALKGKEVAEWQDALHQLENCPLKYIEGSEPVGYTPLK